MAVATESAGVALDCSAALALFLDDEPMALAAALLDALPDREFWVPALWRCEFANALLMAQRRRRLTRIRAQQILSLVERLPLQFDDSPLSVTRLFELASSHGLTAYDAAYLELAQRRALELATLDRELARAAERAQIPLFTARPPHGVHEPKRRYAKPRHR